MLGVSTVKKSLLILELTSEKIEKKSEGWLLFELIKILWNESRVEFPNSVGKTNFLDALKNTEHRYVHVSSHGYSGVRGTSLQVQRKRNGRFMKIKPEDFKGLWENHKKTPKLIVLSACDAGHQDMIKALAKEGVKHVIAPLHTTFWDYTAAFSILFYKSLLGGGHSPWVSYRKAQLGMDAAFPDSTGKWRFYEWGEYIPLIKE